MPPPAAAPISPRDQVRQLWIDAGYSPAATEGILRNIQLESGFDPYKVGDGGTSFGGYQHHGERAVKLQQFAQQHNENPASLVTQSKFAIYEMAGGDPMAHRVEGELKATNDPNVAFGLFRRGFERPAGAPGAEDTNLHSSVTGDFNAGAQALLGTLLNDLQRRGREYDSAISESRDLHTAERAALLKWQTEVDKPPTNMKENWSQWGGAAMALAALGGIFGRHPTAALSAAGAMLQSANAADLEAYKLNYKRWQNHLNNGLKLIELLDKDARDIVGDAQKSYDQKLGELSLLSTNYNLQQRLDPNSLENISRNLQVLKLRSAIIEAQEQQRQVEAAVGQKKSEWLDKHPEAHGVVPADVANRLHGEAERERKGTLSHPSVAKEIEVIDPDKKVVRRGAAYQTVTGDWLWVGTNEPVEIPSGGNVNLKSTQTPRSAPGAYIAKFMEENPNATSDEVSHANALFRADAAYASGPEGRNVTALNTLADHLPLFERYAAALQTGNVQAINAALQRIQEATGRSEITNFNIARDFIADEAVRVMVPGGSAGALADREEMKRNLLARMSSEQFTGAGDVIKDFVHGKLQALRQQFSRGDAAKERYFNTKILTAGAERLFDVGPTEGHPESNPSAAPVIRYDAQGNRIE